MNTIMRTQAWLVGFIASPNRGCFRLLGGANSPFSHCYALRRDEWTGRWLLVEHSIAGLAVLLWPEEKAKRLIDHTLATGHLLMMPRRIREVSLVAPPLQSCVSVIKAVVGVQSFWTITPRQLHRTLLQRGAMDLGSSR